MDLSGTGIWAFQLRHGDPGEISEMAAELDELGYAAVWIPDISGDALAAVEVLLKATRRLTVATGILNLWMQEALSVAAGFNTLDAAYGARFLLGIGVSHEPIVDRVAPGEYVKPIEKMKRYLDELDAAPVPVDPGSRVIAALGPRMLSVARERCRGAHPYFVPPEHTAFAREQLGTDGRPLLAPEQAAVLETDPTKARELARQHMAGYLERPNYANNLRRLGFTEEDLAGGGTDRLVDAIVAWGDEEAIATRVQAHKDAGADHVCVQVVNAPGAGAPRAEWRRLAPALLGG